MKMHSVDVTSEVRETLSALDCWAIGTDDIQHLSRLTNGDEGVFRLRRGNIRGIIAGRKFGTSADRLADEFRCLSEQCATILGTIASVQPAAAFFHLRFENIHPLTDGNGRVGRLLLAEQIRRTHSMSLQLVLNLIQSFERDYRSIFAMQHPTQQFERMVGFVSRLTPLRISKIPTLHHALDPVFPERNVEPALSLGANAIRSVQDQKSMSRSTTPKWPSLKRR